MIKIEVKSEFVHVKQGTSTRTNRPYEIREQEAYAFVLDRDGNAQPYPQKVRIMLEKGQFPHPVGTYTLAPESLFVDRFDQISIRARLRPVSTQGVKAAA
jgi:hypothetical protein